MEWARILAYITGTVDQELLLRNEYLVAENRILKSQLKGRLKLSDVERTKLGEIGHRLGRKALGEVAATALPDTILVLLRHRFLRGASVRIGVAQHGHRDSLLTRSTINLFRMVAIEFGTWRCVRSGGASGSVTVGNGKFLEPRGATRS